MALPPGYTVLPLLKNPNDSVDLKTVHRKISKSYGLAISLIERDIWEDVTSRITDTKHTRAALKESPEFNGIVEGILQINPWFIQPDSIIKVQIVCTFTYYGSDIDRFDFDYEFDIFKDERDLLPNECERSNIFCLTEPAKDIGEYSKKLQALYKKYGGQVGTLYEKEEYINSSGANEPYKQKRFLDTCLKRTDCLNMTDTPDSPYIFINFPFRFDIKQKPDSTLITHDGKVDADGVRNPIGREQLLFDAIHGFKQEKVPEVGVSSSESDDDGKCHHRHPGELFKKKKRITKKDIMRNDQRDLSHKDSYPWFKRQKQGKPHGIRWCVKAYVLNPTDLNEVPSHRCKLNIRKQSYSPLMGFYRDLLPKTVFVDYCLGSSPKIGHDSGLITIIGRTNKKAYTFGDDVYVEIKLHNRSTRLIQRLVIEVVQNMHMKCGTGMVYKSSVCRRICDNERNDKFLPIMPGRENVLVSTVLHPWPTPEQAHRFKCSLPKYEPSLRKQEVEAWYIKANKTIDPNAHLAKIPYPRYHHIPPPNFLYRDLAASTINRKFKNFINEIEEPDIDESIDPRSWIGNPFPLCSCGNKNENLKQRIKHMPHIPPYAEHLPSIELEKHEQDADKEFVKDFQRFHNIEKLCTKKHPIVVSYEVTIRAELDPQPIYEQYHSQKVAEQKVTTKDPFADHELNGYQRGLFGPQLVLPIAYMHQLPQEKIPEPVANFRVQQRQFWSEYNHAKREIWEPSLGRGSFITPPHPSAPCLSTISNK